MNKTFLIAMLLGAFSLSACETIQGAGRDIQSGGKALERAVE